MGTFRSYLTMNSIDKTATFKSYADPVNSYVPLPSLQPNLLPGEHIIAEAQKVIQFSAFSDRKKGVSGSLFVTNFKVTFVTVGEVQLQYRNILTHKIIKPNDIPLMNIELVYQILSGKKKKMLNRDASIDGKIKQIQLYCKNFQVYTYSFKQCQNCQDRLIVQAILKRVYPRRVQSLFAFDYRSSSEFKHLLPTFSNPSDWEEELARTKSVGWRVSKMNEEFRISQFLPESFIVPETLLDIEISEAAPSFRNNRPPIWSWGTQDGGAIVRMTKMIITERSIENQQQELLIKLRDCHPRKLYPKLLDLDSSLPSLSDFQTSYNKLRDLCTPDNSKLFWEQDNHYLGMLDESRWLYYVSLCLHEAEKVARYVYIDRQIVVLQDKTGSDMSCLISSLAQVILDPYFRSTLGFQSLIQKEWVTTGHSFTERLGLLSDQSEKCPVFLLFLDCVWQVTQQCPTSFEFTETYLTTLWDSIHLGIFDTFMFNSCKERRDACKDLEKPLTPRSVWSWSDQFSREEQCYFNNPLYRISLATKPANNPPRCSCHMVPSNHNFNEQNYRTLPLRSYASIPDLSSYFKKSFSLDAFLPLLTKCEEKCQIFDEFTLNWPHRKVLSVVFKPCLLKLWQQCYIRWLLPATIVHGGNSVSYFQQLALVRDIHKLAEEVSLLKRNLRPSKHKRKDERKLVVNDLPEHGCQFENILSFFPFGPGDSHCTSVNGAELLCTPQTAGLTEADRASVLQCDYLY